MLLAQHFNPWAEKAEILASVMETGHTSGGGSSQVNHCSHDHKNNSSWSFKPLLSHPARCHTGCEKPISDPVMAEVVNIIAQIFP